MNYPKIRLVFDRKKKATKEKAAPVYLEIYADRRRKWVSTGVSLRLGQWHPTRMAVNVADAASINDVLLAQLARLRQWVEELRREGLPFTFEEVDRFLAVPEEPKSFLAFVEDRLEGRPDIRESSRKTQRRLIPALKSFGKIIFFHDLTKKNIRAFDRWLHQRDISQGTVHFYHKTLKTYINMAIAEELLDHNPYEGIKVSRGGTATRRYLTPKELEAVKSVEVRESSVMHARDLFLFQAYTGLAYADLVKFDFSAVMERDGRLVVRDTRQKSGEEFYLVLLPAAVEILQRYRFELPIISLQKYNMFLKVVGSHAGLGFPLTSHMGRHTFAATCINAGMPIEVLARAMGHSNIATTQIYARILSMTVERAFDLLAEAYT